MGNFQCIADELRLVEQKALKSILRVKSGTSNDLIYNELKRADTVAKVKDLQCNFYHRILKLNDDKALIKSFITLCHNTRIIQYYESLHNHNRKDNIQERENHIISSSAPLHKSPWRSG